MTKSIQAENPRPSGRGEVNDNRVQVRLDDTAAAWLAGRAARMHGGSTHQQARAELGLWHAVLDAELRRIRLTGAELACVADVAGGSLIRPVVSAGIGAVYAQCYDAFRVAREHDPARISSYGAKHGIGEQDLLDRLGALGPAADHALADAISRWWAGDLDATAEGFAAVGLRVAG